MQVREMLRLIIEHAVYSSSHVGFVKIPTHRQGIHMTALIAGIAIGSCIALLALWFGGIIWRKR